MEPNSAPTLFASARLPELYPWLVLDIETGDPDPADVERWVRDIKRPPANYKADKAIDGWYEDQVAKAQEKAAVLPIAPIYMVALRSPDELRCLHCLEARAARMVDGGLVEGFATRREMLEALARLLDARCDPSLTVLAGHNIKSFDLPRLRLAYARERVRPPAIFFPTHEVAVFDTMEKVSRYFAIGDTPFVSLASALRWMEIPSHKNVVDGSMVPGFIAEGRFDELERYALLDALSEAELYLRMTGQLGDDDAQEGAAA